MYGYIYITTNLVSRIAVIKQGSVMGNKLKYDGDIPVAED